MLTIPKEIQEQIQAHGVAAYPYEGCGLLLGTAVSAGSRQAVPHHNIVAAIRPTQNVWPVEAEKPVRFRIDEQEWVQAELEAMRQGLDVVGVFHSHPDSLPVASPRDLAWAAFAGYSYLITEIRNGVVGDGRSWQLLPDRSGFIEEKVEIR
jgi:proteasome lid subunit RPN8/RPN11